jgi:hypothetical protein
MKRKKGAAGKKYQAGGNDASGHGSGVTSALDLFYGAESGFLSVGETDVVDVDVEFAAAGHAALGLGLGHRSEGHPSLRNDEDVVYEDIFEDFEVDGFSDGGVGRGDGAIGSDFYGCAVFEGETLGRRRLMGL